MNQNEIREAFERELNDVYKALCGNHLTSAVADFLTDLYARVRKLEEATNDTNR